MCAWRAAAAGSLAARLRSLPAHVFQRGPYTPAQRVACFGSKAVQYGAVGFVMGVAGSGAVRCLTAAREALDPTFVPPATEQSVLGTGLGWLYFMGISSNVRYNLINAAEDALYRAAAAGSAGPRIASVGLRLANNFFGAHSWMATARAMKLDRPRPAKRRRQEGGCVPAVAAAA